MHRFRLTGVVLTFAGALAGCKSDRRPADSQPASAVSADSSTAAAPAEVRVTAVDYRFEAPKSVPAGPVTIDLVNQGKEMHQAQIVKLEEGKTVADLAKALAQQGPPPSWIKFVGGANGVAPGGEAHATSVLEPGNYAYLCFIPSPDGKMHAAKGMVLPFQVTAASSATSAEAPTADVTMKLTDYDFTLSQPLKAGHHTIAVENAGPQPHEIVLLKLAPGKKAEDFGKWAETMKGPPPAQPLGGVTFLDAGARGSFTADLASGAYGLICFVPDAKDGKPHFVHGMMKTITVD
jgi:plastocyanin